MLGQKRLNTFLKLCHKRLAENPDDLKPGLLLRLGPVYNARDAVHVKDLMDRFQVNTYMLYIHTYTHVRILTLCIHTCIHTHHIQYI